MTFFKSTSTVPTGMKGVMVSELIEEGVNDWKVDIIKAFIERETP